MKPILFTIGYLSIGSYGVMVAIGFLIAVYIFYIRTKSKVPSKIVFELSLVVLISGFAGGRIFHLLQHLDSNGYLMIWEGGLAYYGGFISACLIGFIYLRSKKLPIPEMMDIIAPSLAVGESIGRIGCFLAGCCYGKPTNSSLGVMYPEKSLTWILLNGQKAHPTQLYSSISLFLIFAILMALDKRTFFSGQLFLIYVIIHSTQRFIIDFFRFYTPEEKIGILATSQTMSLVIGLIALIAMIVILLRRRQSGENIICR
jgi:phosphatidylglycerol:prolipoprotein diacylglycerol transferase